MCGHEPRTVYGSRWELVGGWLLFLAAFGFCVCIIVRGGQHENELPRKTHVQDRVVGMVGSGGIVHVEQLRGSLDHR